MSIDPATLDAVRADRYAALVAAVAAVDRSLRVGLNANRRLLISLRYAGAGGSLSVHHGLLDELATLREIPQWIRARGRGRVPAIAEGMRAVSDRLHKLPARGPVPLPATEPLGGPFDLVATFDRIHATWFAHTPKPRVAWARGGTRRRQTHIRFGCYRRRPAPLITLHPKLDQPWVARVFVEHVIFHELCHHAQACLPLRGETAHSARFREWEGRFPHHELALAWEKAVLHHFLDGTAPAPAIPAQSGVSAMGTTHS
jgi:hypothetical protein